MDRFETRHPETVWDVGSQVVTGRSADGSTVAFDVPFPPLGQPGRDSLIAHLARPRPLGILLVRRGGFAVARLAGQRTEEVKIGRRHVQGRTKAGGWSQQRFARRRENQAQAAYEAAADYVTAILLPHCDTLELIGVGGDRLAIENVLGRAAMAPVATLPRTWLGGVPDPTRQVLDDAVQTMCSIEITLTDPGGPVHVSYD